MEKRIYEKEEGTRERGKGKEGVKSGKGEGMRGVGRGENRKNEEGRE